MLAFKKNVLRTLTATAFCITFLSCLQAGVFTSQEDLKTALETASTHPLADQVVFAINGRREMATGFAITPTSVLFSEHFAHDAKGIVVIPVKQIKLFMENADDSIRLRKGDADSVAYAQYVSSLLLKGVAASPQMLSLSKTKRPYKSVQAYGGKHVGFGVFTKNPEKPFDASVSMLTSPEELDHTRQAEEDVDAVLTKKTVRLGYGSYTLEGSDCAVVQLLSPLKIKVQDAFPKAPIDFSTLSDVLVFGYTPYAFIDCGAKRVDLRSADGTLESHRFAIRQKVQYHAARGLLYSTHHAPKGEENRTAPASAEAQRCAPITYGYSGGPVFAEIDGTWVLVAICSRQMRSTAPDYVLGSPEKFPEFIRALKDMPAWKFYDVHTALTPQLVTDIQAALPGLDLWYRESQKRTIRTSTASAANTGASEKRAEDPTAAQVP